jgi:hypothetical protein
MFELIVMSLTVAISCLAVRDAVVRCLKITGGSE